MKSTGASSGTCLHGLEQHDGVEDLARRHAGGEGQGVQHLRSEGAHVGEAGLHQLQVPAVAGKALVVGPCRRGQALGTQSPHPGAHGGVVEVGVEHDVEDVVEQGQARHVGADGLGLAHGHLVAGAAIGIGQDHVEQTHDLVDDLGVSGPECGKKDGVAPLGGHLAQRPGRRAPGQRGQLAQALGRDGAQVQEVRPQALQVGQLGHLQLHPLGRRRRGAVVQPHQPGHAQLGVGGHQGVELIAALRGQLGIQAPADLLLGRDPG
jgi:hypothetical protein